MLLYRHTRGHYLAVPGALRFAPGCGYQACYSGRDVPDIICAAFIREAGGGVLRESDMIELRAPATLPAAPAPALRRTSAVRPGGRQSWRSRWMGGARSAG